jgi:hypothetical protein
MRNLNALNVHRLRGEDVKHYGWYGWNGDETCGVFVLPSPTDGQPLSVVASSGMNWDHVSVSRISRCPNWPEMEFIKHKFFKDTETAMQLHVPPSDHINNHPYCLHLWRPQKQDIPRPPTITVGVK